MTTMPKKSAVSDTLRSARELAFSSDNGQAVAKAAASWFDAADECQREMFSFVAMRFEKDGEALREMMDCKNISDATAIQFRWIQETFSDYNAEITKMMTIYAKSVNRGGRGIGG